MKAVTVVLAFSLLCAGCSKTPTQPSIAPPTTTDVFSGTLQPLGTNFHQFTVSQAGDVDTTLTSAGPPSTITLGLGVGPFTNGVCSVQDGVSTRAGLTPQLLDAAGPGEYCVTVADVGNLSAPVDYTVTVTHP